jgi:hypothetical protein
MFAVAISDFAGAIDLYAGDELSDFRQDLVHNGVFSRHRKNALTFFKGQIRIQLSGTAAHVPHKVLS